VSGTLKRGCSVTLYIYIWIYLCVCERVSIRAEGTGLIDGQYVSYKIPG